MSEAIRIEASRWDHGPQRRAMISIREAVFVVEQGVPVELELDGLDPACHHVLAVDPQGRPIGTARMQRCGHIGRIAVLLEWRKRGIGSGLLNALTEMARREGLESVDLDAQVHAIGFYEKHGFRTRGDVYLDAGIPHRNMRSRLVPAAPRLDARSGLGSAAELRSGESRNAMSEPTPTREQLEELAELDRARRFYAEEVRLAAQLRSGEVVAAFARVPRERFLGSPPWQLVTALAGYWEIPGADPRATYHNVPLAIDTARALHNGLPSFLATLIEAADVAVGQHVVHIGCGTGYYSAILAELVGGGGRVTAIEVDEELAERARANLADLDQVEVVHADGTRFDPGAADAFLVNAGATHPVPLWLERMLPGARLVLPLTVTAPLHGYGAVLKVTREAGGLTARFISGAGIYPCSGARDEERGRRLGESFARGFGELARVRSLRVDEHDQDESCWLHASDFCVSTRATV